MRIVDRTTERRLGLSWQLQRCLKWIPEGDLFGLHDLVLEEKIGPPTVHSPEWHHRAERDNQIITGQYFAKHGKEPPAISLYIGSLYQGIPSIYWLSPLITLQLARTLAHEVGHHLLCERGYVFQKGERVDHSEYHEEVAERYSFSVRKRMCRRRYYRFGDWLTRDLADWYWIQGMIEWREGCYERAASKWKMAFSLDPNRSDALQWYHEASKHVATPSSSG